MSWALGKHCARTIAFTVWMMRSWLPQATGPDAQFRINEGMLNWWDVEREECVWVLRAQKASLRALGAIEIVPVTDIQDAPERCYP
jgi:hypothetical protein